MFCLLNFKRDVINVPLDFIFALCTEISGLSFFRPFSRHSFCFFFVLKMVIARDRNRERVGGVQDQIVYLNEVQMHMHEYILCSHCKMSRDRWQ